MAIRTDMSKAYDKVEWAYLRSLLLALGFHTKWVEWVMFCVSSVTFSVLINDQPHGLIKPQRRLRQGDPLSPFLFVLCTEGLSYLLNLAQAEGKLEGIQLHEQGPHIHHLLFADDSLFMCKANVDQAAELLAILSAYGKATGQVINQAKSSISFGGKVSEPVKWEVRNTLGIRNEGGAGKYLGLPECFSGSKVEMLSYIKDRLKDKVSGWHAKTLSMGGKEVLIKSVAMAMPVFAMSCFKMLQSTCANLSSAIADYWWSSSEGHRKIHWLSWEKLCLPKELGGMGFRDIGLFNQALLAKQAWRLIQFRDSLFAKVVKSRYNPNSSFLEAGLGQRPSYGWRSIIFGRDLLKKGLQIRVGNGESLKVWMDPWVEDEIMRPPWIKNSLIDINLRVRDLIDFQQRDWDDQKLNFHFFPMDVQRIKKHKPVLNKEEFLVWRYNKSGDFTVKSAYWLAGQINKKAVYQDADLQPSINLLKAQVWKLHTDPKLKVFLWKVLSGALPVLSKLNRMGLKLDERCNMCGQEGELINHVLFECVGARQVWAFSDYPSPEHGFDKGSVYSNMQHLLVNRGNNQWSVFLRKSFPWIIWRIWKNRNILFFEGKSFSPFQSVQKIREDVDEWFVAQRLDSNGEERISVSTVEETRGVVSTNPTPSTGKTKERWKAPSTTWLKCNVGSSWSRRNQLAGGSWVLRDDKGTVVLHSRTAFTGVTSKDQASFLATRWAMESMISHKCGKVVFALENALWVSSVLRPKAWPSFSYETGELVRLLELFEQWRVVAEKPSANRGAHFIALSVTSEGRLHSYVASGYPFWLHGVFEDERVKSSL